MKYYSYTIVNNKYLIVLATFCILCIIKTFGQTTIEFTPAEGVVDAGKAINVSLVAYKDMQPVTTNDDFKIYYTTDGSKASEYATEYFGGDINILPPDDFNTVTLNVMIMDKNGTQTFSAATYIFYSLGQDQPLKENKLRFSHTINTDVATDDTKYYQIKNTANLNDGDIIMFVAGNDIDNYYISMGKYVNIGIEIPKPKDGVIESPIPEKTTTFKISHSNTKGAWYLQRISDNKYWAPYHEGEINFYSHLYTFVENSNDAQDIFITNDHEGMTLSIVAQDAEIKAWVTPNDINNCAWAFAPENERFNYSPLIFRLGTPEQTSITVPAYVSEELYLTLESNFAAEGHPTAYRLKYDPESQLYHASINDVFGDIIIRDGRATLDGIYFGASVNNGSEMSSRKYSLANAPQFGQPVSWTDNPNLTLTYCPDIISPLSTSGNIPLKILEANVAFDHQPGSIDDAQIRLDNLNTTDIPSIAIENTSSPIFYNLQGIRLSNTPTTPGVYIKILGSTTSRVLISQ